VLMVFGCGMTLNHNFILGYSDDETVMLDFDDAELEQVQYWVMRAMKWFKLGGYLILESSPGHYHVVFNRRVDWAENMRIVAWVALHSGNEGLRRWHMMQCIKMKSTLRIGPKLEKPSPRIVKRKGKQKDRISEFLRNCKEVKNLINHMAHEVICL
jgi:hypothetical protein